MAHDARDLFVFGHIFELQGTEGLVFPLVKENKICALLELHCQRVGGLTPF